MPKHLSIDNALDGNLKPVKDSDGTPCALELSTDKARVKSLEISGEAKGQAPTTGDGLATKQYVDDNAGGSTTLTWHHSFGGIKSNNASTTNYYFQYYPNNSGWSNYDSNPSSISYTDAYACEWIAPAASTVTQLDVIVRNTQADDLEISIWKGTVATDGSTSSVSLAEIGHIDVAISTAARAVRGSTTFSSGNTLSAGEAIWIFLRKTEHSATSHCYVSGVVSGEFT